MLLTLPSASCADEADRFYDPNHLLDIRIELPQRDWDELCGQNRNIIESIQAEPVDSPFGYFKGSISIDGTTIDAVGIRKKGFLGSLHSKRPSLKIKLDKYTDKVRYAGLNSLTLNNCKQDQSLLSQWLTYRTYREAGLPAPRLNLAKVTVNGNDLGIYANVESVRSPMLKKNFGNSDGRLYEGTLADFISDRLSRFELKRPKSANGLPEGFATVAQIVETKPLDVDALGEVIDLNQFYVFWTLESLCGFWDGYCNNQNNYFIYHSTSDKRWHFIPWGADVAFSKGVLSFLFKRGNTQSVHTRARIPNALYRHSESRKRYFETLTELLKTQWNEEELLAQTDLVEQLVQDELPEWQRPGFRDAIDAVRRFIRDRRKEVQDEIAKGEPRPQPPAVPGSAVELGKLKISFSAKWNESIGDEGTELPDDSLSVTMNDEKPFIAQSLMLSIGRKKNNADPNIDKDACWLVLRGKLKDVDKTPTKLELVVTAKSFRTDNRYPIRIQGSLTEGEGFSLFNPPVTRAIAGTLDLSAAGTEKGEPVSGTADLRIYKADWGK